MALAKGPRLDMRVISLEDTAGSPVSIPCRIVVTSSFVPIIGVVVVGGLASGMAADLDTNWDTNWDCNAYWLNGNCNSHWLDWNRDTDDRRLGLVDCAHLCQFDNRKTDGFAALHHLDCEEAGCKRRGGEKSDIEDNGRKNGGPHDGQTERTKLIGAEWYKIEENELRLLTGAARGSLIVCKNDQRPIRVPVLRANVRSNR